jgi:hypothetical protein
MRGCVQQVDDTAPRCHDGFGGGDNTVPVDVTGTMGMSIDGAFIPLPTSDVLVVTTDEDHWFLPLLNVDVADVPHTAFGLANCRGRLSLLSSN